MSKSNFFFFYFFFHFLFSDNIDYYIDCNIKMVRANTRLHSEKLKISKQNKDLKEEAAKRNMCADLKSFWICTCALSGLFRFPEDEEKRYCEYFLEPSPMLVRFPKDVNYFKDVFLMDYIIQRYAMHYDKNNSDKSSVIFSVSEDLFKYFSRNTGLYFKYYSDDDLYEGTFVGMELLRMDLGDENNKRNIIKFLLENFFRIIFNNKTLLNELVDYSFQNGFLGKFCEEKKRNKADVIKFVNEKIVPEFELCIENQGYFAYDNINFNKIKLLREKMYDFSSAYSLVLRDFLGNVVVNMYAGTDVIDDLISNECINYFNVRFIRSNLQKVCDELCTLEDNIFIHQADIPEAWILNTRSTGKRFSFH